MSWYGAEKCIKILWIFKKKKKKKCYAELQQWELQLEQNQIKY